MGSQPQTIGRRRHRGLFRFFGLRFESGELLHQFIFVRPAHQVKFHQLQNCFVRFEAHPDRNQQARDDRDIQLKLQAVLTVADEMAAAEDVFEETKKDFNRPRTMQVMEHLLSPDHPAL